MSNSPTPPAELTRQRTSVLRLPFVSWYWSTLISDHFSDFIPWYWSTLICYNFSWYLIMINLDFWSIIIGWSALASDSAQPCCVCCHWSCVIALILFLVVCLVEQPWFLIMLADHLLRLLPMIVSRCLIERGKECDPMIKIFHLLLIWKKQVTACQCHSCRHIEWHHQKESHFKSSSLFDWLLFSWSSSSHRDSVSAICPP